MALQFSRTFLIGISVVIFLIAGGLGAQSQGHSFSGAGRVRFGRLHSYRYRRRQP